MKHIAVLTSGGDSPGMNAALRAVVRTAIHSGAKAFAIHEGYQGMVDGGDAIREMNWNDVGGILQRGGTVIGTARCAAFRERAGRLQAAANLLEHGIDGLVVIGGDGSLTGADILRQEWPGLLEELVSQGRVSAALAAQYPKLNMVGMVGSIDNDMLGTDMTIGADTALHRIVEAIDALNSTAQSHQRIFVVEVMGRHCGYLALMSAIATGADALVIPEQPPEKLEDWLESVAKRLEESRRAGRRLGLIILAEKTHDQQGKAIKAEAVAAWLDKTLVPEARASILGHIQRGGAPSAFDRSMSTMIAYEATRFLLSAQAAEQPPQLFGVERNRVSRHSLEESVARTLALADLVAAKDYPGAIQARGSSYAEMLTIFHTLAQARPTTPHPEQALRLAVLHAGGPAPGMNTAARAAIRLGLDQGHIMLGIENGVQGLLQGKLRSMQWMDVEDWVWTGGAFLGSNRVTLGEATEQDMAAVAATIEEHNIQGLLFIGGWAAYLSAYRLLQAQEHYPALRLPIVCLPASTSNNLPGAELSIGADTALNTIVAAIDKIKQSAVASRRVFVVEVLGRYCGYLALISSLASGAERVYLHEEGVRLHDLSEDVDKLIAGFRAGKQLGVMVRAEYANATYSAEMMTRIFEEEGRNDDGSVLFVARPAILGDIQQGGNPSPFDRIQATRLAAQGLEELIRLRRANSHDARFIGLQEGHVQLADLADFPTLVDMEYKRPIKQWWLELPLRELARELA